jgi:hypothetical protein
MHMKQHLESRIKHFEEKLSLISACRKKEMEKPYNKRNYRILYMFHKDEAVYKFCLTEFQELLNNMQ